MADGGRTAPVAWIVSTAPVAYPQALAHMQARAAAIADGTAAECVWLLEHPAIYTAGTSADPRELVDPDRFPVHATGRGGRYTYHGPGQRIAYTLLDLRRRGGDVRAFVHALEGWVIDTLAVFGISGEVRPDRVGVWVVRPGPPGPAGPAGPVEDKIAALGIRVSRGVTTHGIAINVAPDLSHFAGIVPCGITGHGVTSLAALGAAADMAAIDRTLRSTFEARFGPTVPAPTAIGHATGP